MAAKKLAIEVDQKGENYWFLNQTDAEIFNATKKHLAGKKGSLYISQEVPIRSQQAANFYFHLCGLIAKEANKLAGGGNQFDTETIHRVMKYDVLRPIMIENQMAGKKVSLITAHNQLIEYKFEEISTRKLPVEIFSMLLEGVYQWAMANFNLKLPDPKPNMLKNIKYIKYINL